MQQDGVVAFEGGEDVRVGAQLGQPVDGQIAGTAAGLPAGLDRLRAMPGRDGLEPGRLRLQPALLRVVGTVAISGIVQRHDQRLLGEVQRVGRGQRR